MAAPRNAPRIAVCSWSLQPRDPAGLIEMLHSIELDAVQLALDPLWVDHETWFPAVNLLPEAGIEVVSGMMAMAGEDYSTLQTIAATGGVRPDSTWAMNVTRAQMAIELAERLGVELTTFHAGFIPEDPADPERAVIIDRLRMIADGFAARGLSVGFETGQETAETLAGVLEAIDRPNVGVNFDPANMILYGKGDPVAAIERLGPWVRQVHVKDAVPTDVPGTWGREVPVGEGAVDWPAFLERVSALDRQVDLVIEREAGDDRARDVTVARSLVATELGMAVPESR